MLYEDYRPKTFSDVRGQDKAISEIERILNTGWGAQAWWISGASGTGKTTLAKIIALIGADDFYVTDLDSADKITSSMLDDVERAMHLTAWGKGGRVWIINEAHGLRKPIIRRLLGILERIPRHVVFIFTTTKQGEDSLFEDQIDAHPLLSRCIQIGLTNQGLAKIFAEHCQEIARKENLDGQPLQAYVRLAQRCKNNCREMLCSIQKGEML